MFAPIRFKHTTLLLALCLLWLVPTALTSNAASGGTVATWGRNEFGETTVPVGLSGVTAVAGYLHSLALKNDGTVVGWGANGSGEATPPVGLKGVVAIAAGGGHSAALISDGKVVAWGLNNYGQTNVPSGLRGVKSIAAGLYFTVVAKNDGTVAIWGVHGPVTNIPPGLTGVTAVSAGAYHILALKSDGTVAGWGIDIAGSLLIPVGLNGVVAIAAGAFNSMALKSDGTVVNWGLNGDGESVPVPAGLSGVKAIAAGYNHSAALLNDGTVTAWGGSAYGVTNIPVGLSGVTALSAGNYYSLAIVGTAPAIAPTIFRQTTNQTVMAGQAVSLNVTATGTAPFSYQWRKDAVDLAGQHAAELTITNATRAQSGLYSVMVTNAADTVTSSSNLLRVLVPQRFPQAPFMLGNGQVRLLFGDPVGSALTVNELTNFVVEATTNVLSTNWVQYTTGFSIVGGMVQFDDPDAPGSSRRFYRVIER